VAALLGTALLGHGPDLLAKRDKNKAKKKEKKAGNDKKKDKDRKKAKQRKKRARGEAAPGCCSSGACTAGTSKNLTRCCFEDRTFTGKSFKGSNLTETNFTGANLTNANFASTNMTRACLVDATVTGAKFNNANLSGVILCRTIDGVNEDNSGCDLGTPCCPTCETNADCPDGQACLGDTCATCTVCASGCPHDNLADAVAAASPGDTIAICAGRYHTVNAAIDKQLTLLGAGAGADEDVDTILDAEEDGRVLHVTAGTNANPVVIRNLRITGGNVDAGNAAGGGIENDGALTLLDVSVVGNSAAFVGGGMRNNGGQRLILERTLVAENRAVIAGGGIDNTNDGVVILRAGAVVDDNEADPGVGGGIHNFFGTLTLEAGSRVINNRSNNGGGGIEQFAGGTTTLQNGSRVSGNRLTAGDQGGGIRVHTGTINVGNNALVCNNDLIQCVAVAPGVINGPCPNPASGVCP
jgi:hypothetical protein